MKNDEAIKWVDDRMCWGRGTWTEHHQPNIDDCWQAGQMAIEALKAQEHNAVNHPSHYVDGNIEVIDYIEDKGFGYHLGNAIKYISRAGKKDPKKTAEDLRKAVWYIERYIGLIEGEKDDENTLKFYYVESIDDYWIGRRLGNFYYADWHEGLGFVWSKSHYLPWGEHIVDENTMWKEHTYPSEPIEIPFTEWIVGFMKKHSFGERREP